VKDKLHALLEFIQKEIGEVKGRAFTDSAPVAEKKWAELSGVAWRGKHSLMLTESGSFFFIGELIVDFELDYDVPMTSQCGSCTRCIEACPTGAIVEPYVIDTRKCISYYTIEHKGVIPEHLKGQFRNRVFGCDICQDACPYNKIHKDSSEERFKPRHDFIELLREDWYALSESRFNVLFKNTALERPGFSGLKRNLDFLKS
jgi:epoxyqueuosine reductase